VRGYHRIAIRQSVFGPLACSNDPPSCSDCITPRSPLPVDNLVVLSGPWLATYEPQTRLLSRIDGEVFLGQVVVVDLRSALDVDSIPSAHYTACVVPRDAV